MKGTAIMKRLTLFLIVLITVIALIALIFFLATGKEKKLPTRPITESLSAATQPLEAQTQESTQEPACLPTASPTEEAPSPSESENEGKSESEPFDTSLPTSPVTQPKITYTVSLVDASGVPIQKKMIVSLLQNGMTVAEEKSENGVATFLLAPDTYTVFVDTENDPHFAFDASTPVILGEHASTAAITLYTRPTQELQTIMAYSVKHGDFRNFQAQAVTEGGIRTEVEAAERTYFLFTPTESGEYRITLDSDYAHLLGYFGDAAYPLERNIAEDLADNSFTLNVKESNLGMTYLLGITSSESVGRPCALSVKRIGDPLLGIEDVPVVEIKAEKRPSTAFHAEISGTESLTDLDVTDKNLTVILNEEDGLYHLGTANGPLIYLRIKSASPYLDALQSVAERTGMKCYFYDESGKLMRKEQYNQLFLDYAEIADPAFGLVPLTEELARAVQNVGIGMEWWRLGSPNYLFGTAAVSPDNAWLFAACILDSQKGQLKN